MYNFIAEVLDRSSERWCQLSIEEPALDIAIPAGGSDLTSSSERQTGGRLCQEALSQIREDLRRKLKSITLHSSATV